MRLTLHVIWNEECIMPMSQSTSHIDNEFFGDHGTHLQRGRITIAACASGFLSARGLSRGAIVTPALLRAKE